MWALYGSAQLPKFGRKLKGLELMKITLLIELFQNANTIILLIELPQTHVLKNSIDRRRKPIMQKNLARRTFWHCGQEGEWKLIIPSIGKIYLYAWYNWISFCQKTTKTGPSHRIGIGLFYGLKSIAIQCNIPLLTVTNVDHNHLELCFSLYRSACFLLIYCYSLWSTALARPWKINSTHRKLIDYCNYCC